MLFRKFILLAGLVLVSTVSVIAQHQEINEKPSVWAEKAPADTGTSSLISAFIRGTVHGHFRYFFMATDNTDELSDYYANAVGGGIKYETARFHGFQMAVSGFYIFNVGSSDLSVPDELTGQSNRYEIGLFDIQDPSNKSDIDALEELYIKYTYRTSWVRFGKQLLNTPFINLQDGRMRPGVTEGLWTEFNELKNLKVEAGWIYAFSPRSTSKWYDASESIGLYPSGVNIDGTKSGYAGNVTSKGVAMAGITVSPAKSLKIQAWDLYADNLFNAALLQADKEFSASNGAVVYAGVQGIAQQPVGDGGNEDPSKQYIDEDNNAFAYGARAGWKNKKLDVSLNFNRITGDGRYLMPREWGRDPFFTFMPRERNEGAGDVSAAVIKVDYKFKGNRFRTSLSFGYFEMPDVRNYRLNKYGMPSYSQMNADLRYSFSGFLKGLDAQLLIAAKQNQGEVYGNNKYVINKVDMVNYNLVLNFRF